MNKSLTPLRYPGGKSILSDFFKSFIECNDIQEPIYIEPYCGGAGAAINLLFSGIVSEIWLNDINYSIFSFWNALKYYPDEFLKILKNTNVNIEEWQKQRLIFQSKTNKTHSKKDILSNGFATFFLNRCNRSGILNAGPIGGQSTIAQNAATYKITARFNKVDLTERIVNICNKSDQFKVFNMDALEFLKEISSYSEDLKERFFVYLDPPYYKQGSGLYLNFYKNSDHSEIAEYLEDLIDYKWILSYDNVPEIRTLYPSFDQYSFSLNYSAQISKIGSELIIHSNNSILPDSLQIVYFKRTKKRIALEVI